MDTLLIRDPRINVTEHTDKEHIIISGASRVTEYTQTANSYTSSQVNWSFQPPSTKIIVDRYMRIRARLRLTSTGAPFDLGTTDALRQFPLASIMDTLEMKINGATINDSVANRIHAMLCYNNDARHRNACWSQTAAMPDQFQEYGDWSTYGSARNPLSDYGENSAEMARGGFPLIEQVSANEIVVEVCEPLFLSPLLAGCEMESEGFVNINQFDVYIRWVNDLSRLFSHDVINGGAITNIAVEFDTAPELLVRYFTPNQNQSLPNLQVLPYTKYNDYIKNNINIVSGGSNSNIISDTVKMNQIPRKLMIYLRNSVSSADYTTSDSYANISHIELLWNNESNLLASATENDLFQISKRNGCNLTWPQWHKYRGSVFVAEFGTDIGLVQGLSPGVMGQFTLNVKLTANNVSSSDGTYDFYMSPLYEGTVEITENAMAINLGNLTVNAVEQAEYGPEVSASHAVNAEGGGFFTDMKHFFNKLSRGVQSVSGIATALAPGLSMINPALGAGVGAGAALANQVAGNVRGATGGGISGGRFNRKYRLK